MKIAVVEGNGIGKEVVPAAPQVLDVLSLDIEKVPVEVGYGKWKRNRQSDNRRRLRSFQMRLLNFFRIIGSWQK
ncbi:MAG: hypothetical protein U9N12_03425, partial [Euryarchaeota archaeon]|nr:hypothetical protein [Euryarchaeota archaeon]